MPLEPSPDRGRAPGDSCSHSQFWQMDQSLFHTNDLASCFIATNTAAGGGDQIWTLGLCPFPNQSSQAPTVVNSLNPSNFYTNLSICYPSPQMLKCWEVRTNANHSPRRFLHRNPLCHPSMPPSMATANLQSARHWIFQSYTPQLSPCIISINLGSNVRPLVRVCTKVMEVFPHIHIPLVCLR